MSVLVLTGSARQGSYTRALGALVADVAADGALAPELTVLPFFNQDLEGAPPAEVVALREQVAAADLVVVVTPEYNGTISGLLGNAIDWLSRPYGAGVLRDKPVLAVAASPGEVGGARAVVALRTVLSNAGADLASAALTIGTVAERLADPALRAEIQTALDDATPAAQAA